VIEERLQGPGSASAVLQPVISSRCKQAGSLPDEGACGNTCVKIESDGPIRNGPSTP